MATQDVWQWDDPEEWEDEFLAENHLIPWLRMLGVYSAEGSEFHTEAPLRQVLSSLPLDHIGTGGENIHLVGPDYEVYLWMEDWLSGCIPRQMSYGSKDARHLILSAFARKQSELQEELGEEWTLVLSQDGVANRASRLVFLRR